MRLPLSAPARPGPPAPPPPTQPTMLIYPWGRRWRPFSRAYLTTEWITSGISPDEGGWFTLVQVRGWPWRQQLGDKRGYNIILLPRNTRINIYYRSFCDVTTIRWLLPFVWDDFANHAPGPWWGEPLPHIAALQGLALTIVTATPPPGQGPGGPGSTDLR